MSEERRIYSRLKSGVACLVYTGSVEMTGVIDNISETGIAVVINKADLKHDFRVGERIKVTGLDAEEVLQLEIEIVRLEDRDTALLLGAHIFNHREIEPYVNRKRMEVYFKKLLQ